MRIPAEYLGSAIRRARHQMKWSQEKLAEASGVDIRTISNIERNVGNPTYENLFSLIHVLEIDSREIFCYDEMHNVPTVFHLQQLLLGCSEREAKILMDITKTVLKGMRGEDQTTK